MGIKSIDQQNHSFKNWNQEVFRFTSVFFSLLLEREKRSSALVVQFFIVLKSNCRFKKLRETRFIKTK